MSLPRKSVLKWSHYSYPPFDFLYTSTKYLKKNSTLQANRVKQINKKKEEIIATLKVKEKTRKISRG